MRTIRADKGMSGIYNIIDLFVGQAAADLPCHGCLTMRPRCNNTFTGAAPVFGHFGGFSHAR